MINGGGNFLPSWVRAKAIPCSHGALSPVGPPRFERGNIKAASRRFYKAKRRDADCTYRGANVLYQFFFQHVRFRGRFGNFAGGPIELQIV